MLHVTLLLPRGLLWRPSPTTDRAGECREYICASVCMGVCLCMSVCVHVHICINFHFCICVSALKAELHQHLIPVPQHSFPEMFSLSVLVNSFFAKWSQDTVCSCGSSSLTSRDSRCPQGWALACFVEIFLSRPALRTQTLPCLPSIPQMHAVLPFTRNTLPHGPLVLLLSQCPSLF